MDESTLGLASLQAQSWKGQMAQEPGWCQLGVLRPVALPSSSFTQLFLGGEKAQLKSSPCTKKGAVSPLPALLFLQGGS